MSLAHTPIRTCTGCGGRAPQTALLRFVATPAGLALDVRRRAPGRGGYLHPGPACCQEFLRRKPPLRSLRRSVDRAARLALVQQIYEAQRKG
jgi:hypothetical protein